MNLQSGSNVMRCSHVAMCSILCTTCVCSCCFFSVEKGFILDVLIRWLEVLHFIPSSIMARCKVMPHLAAIHQSIDCPLYPILDVTHLALVRGRTAGRIGLGEWEKEVCHKDTCFERIKKFYMNIYNHYNAARNRTLQQAKSTSNRKTIYETRCYLLVCFFEESGYMSLMVFENDITTLSSPVVRYSSSLLMHIMT